ncbi:MAG: SDR family oxidoreductase [Xanthomonadaceae bacterium]|nr:SDR family oxidoreductase [Xanthomonadaceae bacterium]
MKNPLAGRSVVVTGGASGIGLAAVEMLIDAGCSVVMADISKDIGEREFVRIKQKIDAEGLESQLKFLQTDVSEENDVKAMVDLAVSSYGKLDGAINCAAFTPLNVLLHELSNEQWDRSFAVNMRGMFLCMRHQIRAMLKNGTGSIVAVSSTAAVRAVPSSSDYSANKAGINGLVRAAALDYADKGIRVNCMMPGAIATPGQQKSAASNPDFDKLIELFPVKRLGKAEEAAAGAVFLLSDAASYITGAVLPVDGGHTAFYR